MLQLSRSLCIQHMEIYDVTSNKQDTSSWIGDLFGENFLSIYDVILDIQKELQLSTKVVIPLLPTIIKFPSLMPADGINMRDQYCDFRWKATGLLKKRGVINDFNLIQGSHRWESRLGVDVDPLILEKTAKEFNKEYENRTEKHGEKQKEIENKADNSMEILRSLFLRFHSVIIQLRQRHDNRPTIDINDEYDVQDLLHALLRLYFDDIRPEEWTPSYAGKSARVDFLLKPEKIVIEVKKTRQGLGVKEIGDQLIIDTARYSKMEDCSELICFVYDPENRIGNPGGLESDLSGEKNGISVEVFIVPKQY